MSKNLYLIIKSDPLTDRPEVLFASTSRVKINSMLKKMYCQESEENVIKYIEGDCLFLSNGDIFYIEKADEII